MKPGHSCELLARRDNGTAPLWDSILLPQVSQALKRQTGCLKTYVAQFAEAPNHPHVHFHVMPRMPDQAADDIGIKIFRHLGVSLEQRVGEDQMTDFASVLRRQLEDIRSSA